jgi:hypothetical protein
MYDIVISLLYNDGAIEYDIVYDNVITMQQRWFLSTILQYDLYEIARCAL